VLFGATARQNHAHLSYAAATSVSVKMKRRVLGINTAAHLLNSMVLLLRKLRCRLAGEIMWIRTSNFSKLYLHKMRIFGGVEKYLPKQVL
jgi:hypothetical protein